MRGEKSSANSSWEIFQIASYERILIREIYKVCEQRKEAKGKEDPMLKTKKRSLKKNISILACAAFISASFLGVTHAATRHPSKEFFSPYKSFSLYSPAFSLINFNSPIVVIDPAVVYSLSGKNKKPPKKTKKPDQKDQTDQTAQDNKSTDSSYGDHGNSTSKKKADGTD